MRIDSSVQWLLFGPPCFDVVCLFCHKHCTLTNEWNRKVRFILMCVWTMTSDKYTVTLHEQFLNCLQFTQHNVFFVRLLFARLERTAQACVAVLDKRCSLLLFVCRTRLPLAGSCIGLDLSQWRVSIHKQKIYGACACMKEAAAWWWWWCRSLYWSSLFRAAFAVRRSSHGVYGTGTRSLAYQARCRLNYHSKARRFPFVSVSRIRTFFSDL